MTERSWFERRFEFARPAAFLRRLVVGELVLLVVAGLAFVWASRRGVPGVGVLGWIVGVLMILFVGITFIYPVAVTLMIAAARPAPKPLRERSLLLSHASGISRAVGAFALLVLGGFVGAVIALELDGIGGSATLAGSGQPHSDVDGSGGSGAAIEASVQLVRLVQGWFGGTLLLVWFATVIASIWLGIELLTARRSGRREALQRVTRISGDDTSDSISAPLRRVWVDHLSHWAYPALFMYVAGSFFSFLLQSIEIGMDATFDGIVKSLRGG